MSYELATLKRSDGQPILTEDQLRKSIDRLLRVDGPRYRRLWAYYRNPSRAVGVGAGENGAERPYRQAQEWGLPSRITGVRSGREPFLGEAVPGISRKEVVIENDIGWRIDAMVDYLFGKPLIIESAAPDKARRELLTAAARAIIAASGGIVFLQQLALIGIVHGFVDVLVKFRPHTGQRGGSREDDGAAAPSPAGPAAEATPQDARGELPADIQADPGASDNSPDARISRIARMVHLEIVEPARALPILSAADYRILDAYVQCYQIDRQPLAPPRRRGSWWRRLLRRADDPLAVSDLSSAIVAEMITPTRWQRYEDETLIAEGDNSLGEIPLVHIQNSAVPFEYSGGSDVDGLIPLQDELNTRLSDRASRITLQSFKMYLGKGIDNFIDMPVSPGRMWMTDNENADIIEFGGAGENTAETLHIADLREAMDKASGVSPIAAGAIKNRIGRLTSAAALRVTLIALLAKTDKKRTTYGTGLARMIELAFAWLDRAGVLHTTPEERRVELHWPSPLPENLIEKLQEAESKLRLGVAKEIVLRELGY